MTYSIHDDKSNRTRTYISMETLPFAEMSLVKAEILLVYQARRLETRESSLEHNIYNIKLPAIKLIKTTRC